MLKKKIYIAPYIDNRRFACLSVAYNEMIQANKKNTPYRYLCVRCFCCCGFFSFKRAARIVRYIFPYK